MAKKKTKKAASPGMIHVNEFSGTIDLNPPHAEEMSIDAKYDSKHKMFTGTWDEDQYGTHCTGTWQTPARK